MSIKINSLQKRYNSHTVLDGINMTIEDGMFGLLGRNGAGKTTLMRILATLIKPTNGTVVFNGISVDNTKEIRKIIGYLPQDFSFYPDMTVYESMQYVAALSQVPALLQNDKIPQLLKQVNLWEVKKKKVGMLSGGMKRRLGIAQAMLHDPKVLIVDEPTIGLDPEERLRLYNLLEGYSENRIVILSTHIVADIEATCERVGVLDSGKLVFDGTINHLAENAKEKVFELTVHKNEQDIVQKRYHVLTSQSSLGKIKMRVLSDDYPILGNPVLCSPTVEDGYMQLLRKLDREAK